MNMYMVSIEKREKQRLSLSSLSVNRADEKVLNIKKKKRKEKIKQIKELFCNSEFEL